MVRRNLVLIAALLLAFGLVSVGCSAGQAPTTQGKAKKDLGTIRVGYLPATHDTLFFIALEKKLFEEEGLKVEPFAFKASGEILEAMKADKVDMGIPGIAAPTFFIAQGADFKMVGGAAWYSAMVVTKPERVDEFKSMQGFKGKTIGTVRLATGDVTFRWGLAQAGIDLKKDVTIREFGSPGDVMAAAKAGHVDAAVLWEPYGTVAESQGLSIIAWTRDIYPHPCCRQVVTAKYLEKNPEAVKAYLKGIIRAEQFFKDSKNKDEVVKILRDYLKIEDELINKSVLVEDPKAGGTRTYVSPRLGAYDVKKYITMMGDIGYITKEGAERAIASVDDRLIKQAYQELGLPMPD